MKQIQLRNESITLRPYKSDDVDRLFPAVRESVRELSPWMPWCQASYALAESKKYVEERAEKWDKGISYDFAITDSKSGYFLGGCGLNDINASNRFANLGYWVRSTSTKHGIATAATLLLSQFAFNELKLNRVEILIAIENTASQRVAEKAGAKREGILRNRFLLNDKVHDAVMFSLIPSTFL
jgi:ribosomal-protein-serine acetyltransferase